MSDPQAPPHLAPQPPPELRLAIERDLRPVRPLPPPWRRALAFAPIALAALVALPVFWGFRVHLDALGVPLTWGLSILQVLVALAVLAAALRESVPGRNLAPRTIVVTIAAAVAAMTVITILTDDALPVAAPPAIFLRWAWECWGVSVLSGLLPFAVAAWLVARTFPTRPALAGALGGFGIGIAVDAGLRLYCRVTAPMHVLVSHGGAVLTLTLLGAVVASAADRWVGGRRRVEAVVDLP